MCPKPKSWPKRKNHERLFEEKRRFRKRAFNLQKVLFILPNAFTLGSVLCGMYAIAQCVVGDAYLSLYQAALAIFVAGFLDSFDGRVARMTKTQSEFGVQMDSLADAVSFGVAPAIFVYKWALWPLGMWGLGIVFVFSGCGIIRLARFNVLSSQGPTAVISLACPFRSQQEFWSPPSSSILKKLAPFQWSTANG